VCVLDAEVNGFFRGLMYALPISLVLWALIIWGVWAVFW
jgi:hypothetical protein